MGAFLPGGGAGGTGPSNVILQVLSGILGLGGSQPDIQAAIEQAISFTYENVIAGEEFLFGDIAAIAGALKSVIGSVIGAIAHVISDILHGLLYKLLQQILALLHKLHDLLAPLIAWLKKLQAIQRQIQMQYLRKFVDLIQRARKILVIFRLLHLKFASKLDADLARIEGGVAGAFAKIIARQNAITGILDAALDPRVLLRPGNTLGSIGQGIGALQQAIGALGFGQLLCLPADNPAQPVTQPWLTTQTLLESDMRHNTGDYAVFHAARDNSLRQYAIDLGVNPLV